MIVMILPCSYRVVLFRIELGMLRGELIAKFAYADTQSPVVAMDLSSKRRRKMLGQLIL